MATNGKSGDNRRHGAVKKRSQVLNPKTNKWVKEIQKQVVSWMEKQMINLSKASEKKSNYAKIVVQFFRSRSERKLSNK